MTPVFGAAHEREADRQTAMSYFAAYQAQKPA